MGNPSRWEMTMRKHPLSRLLPGGLLGGRGCLGSENHSSRWPPSDAAAHSLDSLRLPTGHSTLLVSPFCIFGNRHFINLSFKTHLGLPRWCSAKECVCQCRRSKRHGFDPWVGKIHWRKKGQPTPVFLAGKFQADTHTHDSSKCCMVSSRDSEFTHDQSCQTLCNPSGYSPPGSSVHGFLQARILEWVAMPSSRESSPPRGRTQVSHIASRFFTVWATREAPPMC